MSKNFASSSRPISRDQLNSIREKFVRDSPNLYKQNILSYPKLESHSTDTNAKTLLSSSSTSSSQLRDPLFNLRNLSLGNPSANINTTASQPQQSEIITYELSPIKDNNVFQTTELGNFENPVLQKLLKRSINKEQEFHTIVANIIGLSLWNLIAKFLILFFAHSTMGKQLYCTLDKRIWSWKWLQTTYGNKTFGLIISEKITWNHINYTFHVILCCNLIFSIYRLFSNGKTTDLKLSDKQKQLLGLNNINSNNKEKGTQFKFGNQSINENMNKPHLIQMNGPGQSLHKKNNSNVAVDGTPSTPFLFKSLKTPQKLRQQQQLENMHFQPINNSIYRTNAFGDLRKTAATNNYSNNNFNNNNSSSSNPYITPGYDFKNNNKHSLSMTNEAYVASPKYSYLMNSPGPNHL
ncbi:some similarities with Saccharomyces cerevisiae YLR018C POM34 Integral membrane protein of the nuclear pore [Maudiozyma barnettii]|nr:some similarities with Saccharomyces cerevisiae YLR018C POM34 Integral membrane protein of the nuclear pore [Kazachstania barnettii]